MVQMASSTKKSQGDTCNLAFLSLGWEDCKLQDSLGYVVSPCQKRKRKKDLAIFKEERAGEKTQVDKVLTM